MGGSLTPDPFGMQQRNGNEVLICFEGRLLDYKVI
uniref:Bm13507 n=1 Tax=Brugia malayi TaxID=6279 RepID=A0A1I9G3I9_BRUMA|nr:Bm13507 [Brugia malayi]